METHWLIYLSALQCFKFMGIPLVCKIKKFTFALLALAAFFSLCPLLVAASLKPPQLKFPVKAVYPQSMLDQAPSGNTTVRFEVNTKGQVQKLRIDQSSGTAALDASALDAAKQFEFEPAQDGSGPVLVEITYTFKFKAPEKATTGQFIVKVIEKGTRNPAVGVPVVLVSDANGVEEVSAITDDKGVCQFVALKAGGYTVAISSPEYKTLKTKEMILPRSELATRYLVERQSYDPFQTIVEETRIEETSRRVLRSRDVDKAAGTQGDPIRVIQNLPGVARPAAGSGQLSIRGSAPFESRYFLDDLEVPILFHFGGLRTVYNSEIIDHIDFLPGGFTARYGDAVGGVVSTYTRAPRKDRYHLIADINTFDSQILVEGPLAKNLSFFISGRRSYIDLFLKAIVKNRSGFNFLVAPRYYDYQGELEWLISPRDKRVLQLIGSDDTLEFLLDRPVNSDPALRGNFRNHTAFHRLALHWHKAIGEKWTSVSRLGFGRSSITFDTSNGPFFRLRVNELSFRQEATKEINQNLGYSLGATGEFYTYQVAARFPAPTLSGGVSTPIAARSQVETNQTGFGYAAGPFALLNWKPSTFIVTPSIRLDTGDIGTPVTVDPRLSVKDKITALDTIKASTGIYHQRPLPQEAAKDLGNPDLKSKYAIQYVVGYERDLPLKVLPLALDLQLFYRDLHRQIVATGNAKRYDNTGTGSAVGSEVYLKYGYRDSINGWISYTLGRSLIRENDRLEEHPFANDQTHILTFIGNIPLGRQWEFGWRFRYTTGNPNTPVNDSVYSGDGDAYIPIRGPLYSSRLPSFHQLDLRIEKKWVHDTWLLTAFFELNNAYNRKNVEGVNYAYDYRTKSYTTGLPLIPTFGVRGEF